MSSLVTPPSPGDSLDGPDALQAPWSSPGAPAPYGRPVRRRLGFRIILLTFIALTIAWLAVRTTPTPYLITSGSMLPKLKVGQRVMVDRDARTPRVGNIVAFYAPKGSIPDSPVCGNPTEGMGSAQMCGLPTSQRSRNIYVKRIVAGPGDRVSLVHGHLWLNGRAVHEPYASTCRGNSREANCEFTQPVTVPEGDVFLLGDERYVSDDSRYWGPVPASWIVGTVVRCSLIGTICHAVR